MECVGNYAPHGLSPQPDGMPVMHSEGVPFGTPSACPQSPSASNAEGLIRQNIRQKQDQNTKMGYIQYKTTKADDPF